MHKHFIKTSSGQMIDPGKVDSLGWVGETGIRINVGGEIVTDHWPTIGDRRLWAVELDYARRGLDFIRGDWAIVENTPIRRTRLDAESGAKAESYAFAAAEVLLGGEDRTVGPYFFHRKEQDYLDGEPLLVVHHRSENASERVLGIWERDGELIVDSRRPVLASA